MNTSTEILTQRKPESATASQKSTSSQKSVMVVVPWDKQKSYTFLVFSLCFIIWACVYFPFVL
ncbi:hypothetical protein NQ317_018401 [Molorchus minor]|uniref:Uncharacterized protein n=1 Tax=Molorchus minor TaxID=1323400 RepID=A0ABQ9J6I0_9CUCU|nr:hypothetical protein NQ317_018401 [Molorchus minor]